MPLIFSDDAQDYVYVLLIVDGRPNHLLLYSGAITDETLLELTEDLARGRVVTCDGGGEECYSLHFEVTCKCWVKLCFSRNLDS